uniref:Uncharacterized protein n=1 Tax=Strongyloides stercoralis TaxID=6248 RepID=A0A0K0ELX5_STRER
MNKDLLENVQKIIYYHLNNKVVNREKVYEIEPSSYEIGKKFEPKSHEILLMQLIGMVISFITIIQALRTLVYYRYER